VGIVRLPPGIALLRAAIARPGRIGDNRPTVSDFVSFLFSIGGMTCALLAGLVWALARSSSPAPRRFIGAVILAYSAAAFHPVTYAASQSLSRPYHPLTRADVPPGPSAVVILGSGSFTAHDWRENSLAMNDPAGADRVIEASRIFKMIDPEVVVSSGGSIAGMDPNAPGGEVMKDQLLQLGVPEKRILVEVESQNTHDEAVIIKRMLEPLKIEHLVLVTSDIHMRRSVGTFRAVGLEVIPGIARTPRFRPPWNIAFLPSAEGIDEARHVAHEFGGIGYYMLRGWYK
jgi:uncharacterized SAM-binding protein YcdF (DUF218 family)